MLGAVSRLEEQKVSSGSDDIPKRENVRISAASHTEGRHARRRWCGSTASRDRACEGLVYKSTLEKEDRQGERWNEIRRVLVHTLKVSRHRRRLLRLMSEVSRVRKAVCGVSRTVPTRGVRHSPASSMIVRRQATESTRRHPHKSPCGRVHHSQVSYRCSAGERNS